MEGRLAQPWPELEEWWVAKPPTAGWVFGSRKVGRVSLDSRTREHGHANLGVRSNRGVLILPSGTVSECQLKTCYSNAVNASLAEIADQLPSQAWSCQRIVDVADYVLRRKHSD